MMLRWKGDVCPFDNKIREVSVWFKTRMDVSVIEDNLKVRLVREFWREGEIFNLKCLVQFLEGEGRGANFIALSKLFLY